jgi:hypothetical protein
VHSSGVLLALDDRAITHQHAWHGVKVAIDYVPILGTMLPVCLFFRLVYGGKFQAWVILSATCIFIPSSRDDRLPNSILWYVRRWRSGRWCSLLGSSPDHHKLTGPTDK